MDFKVHILFGPSEQHVQKVSKSVLHQEQASGLGFAYPGPMLLMFIGPNLNFALLY
jgi:hypothetical protein